MSTFLEGNLLNALELLPRNIENVNTHGIPLPP